MENSEDMRVIDGAQGEGGGQVFRTSLSLAICLQLPVRINNIRAGRKKPGLLRQHLTCLRAAKEISGADVEGDFLGSQEVCFTPKKVRAGKYRFSIGSAGSTCLVFQTILMPLLFADSESEVYFEGGTHNGSAPSFDFIADSFLPAIKKIGYSVEACLERFGFYPAGGGVWFARIRPVEELVSLSLLEKGREIRCEALATSARLPSHVTERELDCIKQKLAWLDERLIQRRVSSAGPGNILSLKVENEHSVELVEVVGEKGVKAESVAQAALTELQRYLDAGAVVGEHLADQLLLPMVLAKGGCFSTLQPSSHLLTNIDVMHALTGARISLDKLAEEVWRVRIVC